MVYVLMLRRTLLSASMAWWIAGCQSPPEPPPEPPTQSVCHDALGVCLALPAAWLPQGDGAALLYAGPASTDAFYTVISLQGVVDDGAPLEAALDLMFAPLASDRRLVWQRQEPRVVSGRPALHYDVAFDLEDSPRRRVGLLLAGSGVVVDLAYSAVPRLFWSGLPAFDTAVETLSVAPPEAPGSRGW
ncbi:MAG: hypothetical protein HY903_15055 [Deltaproteobacteria bacterium]|nr:hypothetical protein [Deltaproteobacteria bacterium]